MARITFSQSNFSAGELSPIMRGRFDLEVYYKSASYMMNFIAETQGPARFRGGTVYAAITRNNQKARMLRFQFNVQQSYALELTNGYMRIFKDGGIVTETPKTITNISSANPGVVTANAHGYDNGNQVYIKGVVGPEELNFFGPYTVAGVTTNTFQLQGIDTTALAAYVSGGTVERVVEVKTPWLEADLFQLQVAQIGDTMYVTHNNYEPMKLKRGASHSSWSVFTYARTADPFATYAATKTITAITKAQNAQITATGHGYTIGKKVKLAAIVGMTELNGQTATVVSVVDANNFTVNIDTRNYTTYTSAGTAAEMLTSDFPAAVTYYQQRVVYANTPSKTQTIFFSRSNAPDDMTTGTLATDGMQYTIGSEEINAIQWLAAGQKYLVAGTFGGPFKVSGSDTDAALTPNNIRVTPGPNFGCDLQTPIKIDNIILYTQRDKITLRSFQQDPLSDAFKAIDANLVADHITLSGITQLSFQTGRPDLVWASLNSGRLLGLNYKQDEAIQGWFQFETQGSFISTCNISQPRGPDQQWVCVVRNIEGVPTYFVEYFKEQPVHPRREDFYKTPGSSEAERMGQSKAEKKLYDWALYESQKGVYHVDCGLSATGLMTTATLDPAAASGDGVTFTASTGVFKASDVGRQIWRYGAAGRAEIVTYTSPTQVVCNILAPFDNADIIPASMWYLTFDELFGLHHLEGKEVTICADGGSHPNRVVEGGYIQLDQQVSVAHIGLGYKGLVISQNLEAGGNNGPAQTKPRNVAQLGVQFLNSLGCKVGTDFYKLEKIKFYETSYLTGRPPLLYNGSKVVPVDDDWTNDKYMHIYQDQPLPCVVLGIIPYMTTNDT